MNPTQITTDTLIRKIGLLVVENDLLRGQVQAATQQITTLQKKLTPEAGDAVITETPKRRGRPAQQAPQEEKQSVND